MAHDTRPETDEETDVVLELDELGSLVIDLRSAYEHPATAAVAAHHLELMQAAARAAHHGDDDADSVPDA